MDELPMAQGWAFIAHEVENDAWLAVKPASKRYIGQEVERLMAMVK